MTAQLIEVAGERCLIIDREGAVVRDAGGARDLIEEAMNDRASMIVVPVIRLDPAFFQLRSGLAGEVLQTAMNYGYKFAVVGDISAHIAASDALRDFVIESNRGREIFFVPDMQALEERLAALATRDA
jgi:uncharacterized protein DUF4180